MEAASRSEFEPIAPDPDFEPLSPDPSEVPRAKPAAAAVPAAPASAPKAEPATLSLLEMPVAAPAPSTPPAPAATPATQPAASATAPVQAPPAARTVRPAPAAPAPARAAPSAPTAPTPAAAPSAAAPAKASVAPSPTMDRDFIARNHVVERYLSGKLPIKAATEFERFCKEHPQLLDELGVPERVNSGLRLLEAAGKPEPWHEEHKRPFWESPLFTLGLGAGVFVLLIAVAALAAVSTTKSRRIAELTHQVSEQPLEPATATRTIRVVPSHSGPSSAPAVVIGGGATQLADLKIDMSHSQYREFRVTVDRIDQGRVLVIHNLEKDSNGHLRIALNSSALGPGNYQFTIEGLTWRGEAEPDGWVTLGVQR